MSLREFEQNDVFVNVMKTKPHCKFSIYNGKAYHHKIYSNTVPDGFAGVNDLNLNISQLLPDTGEPPIQYSYDFSPLNGQNTFYLSMI
jgi:hypothetical protein